MIGAHDVSISFGGVKALDRVTLSCGPGQVVGVVGPSGSGKTTLFEAIAGRHRLASGSITVGDARVDGLAPYVVARRGLAHVHQEDRLFGRMTAFENALVGAHARTGAAASHEARAALEAAGLSDRARSFVWELAPGERRRLALARALASGARALVLDEPLRSLDVSERELVVALIRRTGAADGRAVVMSDRDVEACAGLCDSVVVLHAGKAIATGTFDEVVREQDVRDAYLGVEWRL